MRVVPPAKLDAQNAASDKAKAAAEDAAALDQGVADSLAGYVRGQWTIFKNHRNEPLAGWSERLLIALRAFNGHYDSEKLAQIKQFGGSDVYARLIAQKCRGTTALLRDVYLTADIPWAIDPPADPEIPAAVTTSIKTLVQGELSSLSQAGQPIDPGAIRDRVLQLMEAARSAAKKAAAHRAEIAQDKIQELLTEGGFYKSLAEFLVDLPLFPFACIKGPVVRIVPTVSWDTGRAVVKQTPKLFWQRVSPFDIWFTPGVSDIEDASVIERCRYTRAELNDLLDLPGYDKVAIRAVLDEYGASGFSGEWDVTDTERAVGENRENPIYNKSGLIACMEFHGNVQGKLLQDKGILGEKDDPLRDYFVQAWVIGQHVIKVQLEPSPRKRHPYFITSFEKVPGTPVGNGLPDILSDIQDVANASLRALVNNLSISSGPQVVVNDERMAPGADGDQLFPWKRWHVTSDPMGNNTQVPISFFQPNSNAQEMLSIYAAFNAMADDLAAIPKYITGQSATGVGRTAAGLAMLMANASKILQTVAANIDRDILEPLLGGLYDMIMLTDTSGLLAGDESIRIMGVNVAVQRETQRSRQLEFLQVTANPVDTAIIGPRGRAEVLRAVANTIGLDGETIVPTDEQIAVQEQQAQQNAAAAAQQGADAQGTQKPPSSTKDVGPRATVSGGVH